MQDRWFTFTKLICFFLLQETVFYVIHTSELAIALKFTCDYRRLNSSINYYGSTNNQPCFISSVSEAISKTMLDGMEHKKNILILSKISGSTETQSDYYIRYVVDFNELEIN